MENYVQITAHSCFSGDSGDISVSIRNTECNVYISHAINSETALRINHDCGNQRQTAIQTRLECGQQHAAHSWKSGNISVSVRNDESKVSIFNGFNSQSIISINQRTSNQRRTHTGRRMNDQEQYGNASSAFQQTSRVPYTNRSWNQGPRESRRRMNSDEDNEVCVARSKPDNTEQRKEDINVFMNSSKSDIRNSMREKSCPVCLMTTIELSASERHFVATICGHIFCNKCIEEIIKKCGSTCPLCRNKICTV